ncbi:MAG: DNA helicase RecQ, partial [Verrucomicrobia bacterium]|nr:DNA helicase RecQ [Verrucomicrobiota bacterium]
MIRRCLPPQCGGPETLYDGLLQRSPTGALYISRESGVPTRSTLFWIPDQPLTIDTDGKRIRYRYPTSHGGNTLTFVGFQEPIERIPAGTLLRVSLAHWWRPTDRPEDELRCYAQLSGWFANAHNLHPPSPRSTPASSPTTAPARISSLHSTTRLDHARHLLKQVFGFADFLPRQAEVIRHVLEGHDALAVMPTGGGKSLCYQLPALVFDGLTVVISPLIALMQDQVNQLHLLDVPAAFLNCTLKHRDWIAAANRARAGQLKLLYVAPETLLRPETLRLLEDSRLACLAVDEAHCISEWGHDFRPEYRQLRKVRRRFPSAVCLGLTATATPRVREDIRQLLEIDRSGEFIGSFNRPNLFLAAQPRRDPLHQTIGFLEQHRDQSGVIYCATRRQVDQLAAELRARGWPVLPYHAGLDDTTRKQNQERFTREETVVMVATIAFGMGINKSNVRFVLHYHLPKDLESYYQEIGRAGRDGLPADCLLLHSAADASTIRHFISQGAPSERPGRLARLEAMLAYADARNCRRQPLLAYFGQPSNPCRHCDHCLRQLALIPPTDVTHAARLFLSCILETGELFGVAHIIQVLRGSRAQRITSKQHDRLPCHGAGRHFPIDLWRELTRQFIAQELVDHDPHYGSLRINAKSRRVQAGEKVFAHLDASQAFSVAPRPEGKQPYDQALFQNLRRLRRELADRAGVPPYLIFSDRTLIDLAIRRPRNMEEFLAIHGVGEAKLARYATAFLEVIQAH